MLSDGTEFDSELIVWTAGNAATRLMRNHTDLPHTERGLVQVRADLRIGTDANPVTDAWAAGDDAAVPDLASPTEGAFTVPNAQNAVRQGKLLAKNLVRTLRGREPKQYVHHSLGAVATLGSGEGDLPVPADRHQGLPRVADASRVPRPCGPDVGPQGARLRDLGWPRRSTAGTSCRWPRSSVRGRRSRPRSAYRRSVRASRSVRLSRSLGPAGGRVGRTARVSRSVRVSRDE